MINGALEKSERNNRIRWFKREILVHEPAIRRYLRQRGVVESDIDDFVSEALTRAYSSEDWRGVGNGAAYLYQICRNLLRDTARREKIISFDVMADMDHLGLMDTAPSNESLLSARDELRLLLAAAETLPPKCREIFLLRRVDDFSTREVASHLGISIRTVESQMAKAMAVLARALATAHPSFAKGPVLPWRRKQTR